MGADLVVVIPCYNERDNVALLYQALARVLAGRSWEAVFVDDDSPDGTAEAVRELARTDPRVRCLVRIGRRGLSSACIEGAMSSQAPAICIMDADLQHDETLIPRMLDLLDSGNLDVVVATRYAGSGSLGGMSPVRARLSRLATWVARVFTRVPVSDPMSGFFLFRRRWFDGAVRNLSGRGFKILLDLLLSSPGRPRYGEVSYVMRARSHGESKLSAGVIWDFGLLLAHRALGRLIPARFISFAAVGMSGVGVHMAALWGLHRLAGLAFVLSQAAATLVAMTSNFFLNNHLTYGDRRLRGARVLGGLASFCLACAVGAIINVALASWAQGMGVRWWLAGLLGVVAGAVWNFASTAVLTWRAAGD